METKTTTTKESIANLTAWAESGDRARRGEAFHAGLLRGRPLIKPLRRPSLSVLTDAVKRLQVPTVSEDEQDWSEDWDDGAPEFFRP